MSRTMLRLGFCFLSLLGTPLGGIAGDGNTGIAIVNPNAQDATINFSFTSETGTVVATGTVLVPGKTQLAKYFTEMPFQAPSMHGTFTFTSSVPVAVVAFRFLTNER